MIVVPFIASSILFLTSRNRYHYHRTNHHHIIVPNSRRATPSSSSLLSSSTSSSSNDSNNVEQQQQQQQQQKRRSPWSPSEWTITMNIGREPGTDMLPEWGASGARLILPIELLIESEYYYTNTNNNNKQGSGNNVLIDDFFGSTTKPFQLSVLEDPSYITLAKGQVPVPFVETGAWKLSSPPPRNPNTLGGEGHKIRFWLDVASTTTNNNDSTVAGNIAAQKNDVTLFEGERLYFISNCWYVDSKEIQVGIEKYERFAAVAEEKRRIVDERLVHETGDRRLDGTNPIDTVVASLDMAVLIKQRDDAVRAYQDAQRILPSKELVKSTKPGFWPGSDQQLIVAPGTIAIQKRRRQSTSVTNNNFGSFFPPIENEYSIIGTFTAKPSDQWEIID